MYKILFCFFFPLLLSCHQSCISSKKTRPPRILQTTATPDPLGTINSEKARNAKGEKSLFKNIRITYDYQFFNTQSITQSAKDFLLNTMLPSLKSFLESSIKIYPRNETFYPPKYLCNEKTWIIADESQKKGYNNTDLVIFLLGEKNSLENYIAWASMCDLDPSHYYRPVSGVLNMNFHYLNCELVGFESCFNTLIHEMMHIMYFNSYLYDYFVDDNGIKLGSSNVIRKKDSLGTSYQLILKGPLEYAKTYFGCSTLTGIDLENNEDQPGSHWEDSIFRDEVMSPIDRPSKTISNFSFVFMGSVGWYIVNYEMIQDYFFGSGRGCDFPNLGCKKTPLLQEFCSSTLTYCQDDYSGLANCYTNSFSEGCKTMDSDYSSLCKTNLNQNFQNIVLGQGGVISGNSFCVKSSLNTPGNTYYQGSCYKSICYMDGSTQKIKIYIGTQNKEIICAKNGDIINVEGYNGQLTCPTITDYCKHVTARCVDNCLNSLGYCAVGAKCLYLAGTNICSSDCVLCSDANNCLICEYGFILAKNSKGVYCSKCIGECPYCMQGQFFNIVTNKCEACHSSCLTCSAELSSNCLSCELPKIFKESKCIDCSIIDSFCMDCEIDGSSNVKCKSCKQGYFLGQLNKCEKCSINNCIDCNSLQCLVCSSGFFLKDGECLPCLSSCATCKDSLSCLSCPRDKYLNGNKCENIDCSSLYNCKYCYKDELQVLKCSTCKQENFLDLTDNICYPCSKSCLECSSKENCVICQDGFAIQKSVCEICPIPCKTCNDLSGICKSCIPNYELDKDGNCNKIVCDNSCKDCNGKTKNNCINCFDGFYLSSDSSCLKCSEQCKTCFGPEINNCFTCKDAALIDYKCYNETNYKLEDIKTIGGLLNLTIEMDFNDIAKTKQFNLDVINKIQSLVTSNLKIEESFQISNILNRITTLSVPEFTQIEPILNIIEISLNKTKYDPYKDLNNSLEISKSFLNSINNIKKALLSNSNTDVSTKIQLEKKIYLHTHNIINKNMITLTPSNKEILITTNLCDIRVNYLEFLIGDKFSYSINTYPSIEFGYLNDYLIKKDTGTFQLFLKMISWNENPYKLTDTKSITINNKVIDIEILGYKVLGESASSLKINNMTVPLSIKLPKTRGENIGNDKNYSCVFWNTELNKWDNTGVKTIPPNVMDGFIECTSTHLTSFTNIFLNNTNNTDTNNTNNTQSNTNNSKKLFYFVWKVFAFILILII